MIVDYDSLTRASTLLHRLQGGAFLLLGAAELYALKNPGKRAELIGPLALLLAGFLGFAVILALPGGGEPGALAAALAARGGFRLFIAFSCLFLAAGLSGLMAYLTGPVARRWQVVFILLLTAVSALYFLLPWRVHEDAWRAVFVPHAVMGGALLLALLAKVISAFSGRRAFQAAWAALVLLTAVQLLAYREAAATFGPRMQTLQAGALPEGAPPDGAPLSPEQQREISEILKIKNAKPADKKRSGN